MADKQFERSFKDKFFREKEATARLLAEVQPYKHFMAQLIKLQEDETLSVEEFADKVDELLDTHPTAKLNR